MQPFLALELRAKHFTDMRLFCVIEVYSSPGGPLEGRAMGAPQILRGPGRGFGLHKPPVLYHEGPNPHRTG